MEDELHHNDCQSENSRSGTRHSSLANQRPLDDEMRKTLIVQGMRARFVLGWVGLASTDDQHRHKTPDWTFKHCLR
jgi:hypothetical protein